MKPQPCNPHTFGISPIWGSGVPNGDDRFCVHAAFNEGGSRVDKWLPCPYGQPGDRLWVRERWASFNELTEQEQHKTDAILKRFFDGSSKDIVGDALSIPVGTGKVRILYASDFGDWADNPDSDLRWKSPLFMPRWASRITLEIVNVRVERVQEISHEDAIAEGVDAWIETLKDKTADLRPQRLSMKQLAWSYLWDSLNAEAHPWSSNPWVWVIEFKRREAT